MVFLIILLVLLIQCSHFLISLSLDMLTSASSEIISACQVVTSLSYHKLEVFDFERASVVTFSYTKCTCTCTLYNISDFRKEETWAGWKNLSGPKRALFGPLNFFGPLSQKDQLFASIVGIKKPSFEPSGRKKLIVVTHRNMRVLLLVRSSLARSLGRNYYFLPFFPSLNKRQQPATSLRAFFLSLALACACWTCWKSGS